MQLPIKQLRDFLFTSAMNGRVSVKKKIRSEKLKKMK